MPLPFGNGEPAKPVWLNNFITMYGTVELGRVIYKPGAARLGTQDTWSIRIEWNGERRVIGCQCNWTYEQFMEHVHDWLNID